MEKWYEKEKAMLLEEKVALVTGSSRGVGAGIARLFAKEAAYVYVNYFKSKDKATALVKEIESEGGRATAIYGDVTSMKDVQCIIDTIATEQGKLNILVNNALPHYEFNPEASYTKLATLEWECFQKQLEGAIRATFHTAKASFPLMKKQGGGKVINISTNLVYNPVVTYYDYTTAKAGLVGLTRNLAQEYGKDNITVNLLAGGLIKTTDASKITTPEVFDYVAGVTPLKKVISVEDFAKAVLFFASDFSDVVTGQSIAVDGGLTMS